MEDNKKHFLLISREVIKNIETNRYFIFLEFIVLIKKRQKLKK